MKTYLISDTHFGHRLLAQLGVRPKNYESKLINAWHKQVKPEDAVIHLGDLAFNSNTEIGQMMQILKGNKIFVRGNHDGGYSKYYKMGFNAVCDEFKLEYKGIRILFSHKPIHPAVRNSDINIHGHLHGDHHRLEGELEWYLPLKEATGEDFPYIDLAPELWGYRLVSLEEVLVKYRRNKLPSLL